MSEAKKYLDFEIIKESWNAYDLSDGTKLKTRNVLLSMWSIMKEDQLNYSSNIQSHVVLMCASNLQGTKDQAEYSQEQLAKNIDV